MTTGIVPGLEPAFVRRFYVSRYDLIAARWWHMDMPEPTRGSAWFPAQNEGVDAMRRLIMVSVGSVMAAALLAGLKGGGDDDDDGTATISSDALELQRKEGWSVAATNPRLSYRGSTGVDVAGHRDWAKHFGDLANILWPTQPVLKPYAVTTLWQMLDKPTFTQGLFPMRTDETDRAFARGQALAALFRDPQATPGTALIVDAAGAEAVAVAAGLADTFEPVFLFDNWPHPDGVVPSHDVIASALYYAPVFEAERASRSSRANPAFILDRWRLSPYTDAPSKFDNRYLARLPSARGFADLDVRRILYVTDAPHLVESDDLNDDFVALAQAGIDIKIVDLGDFRPPDPSQPLVHTYGGFSHTHHTWFWHSYGTTAGPAPRGELAPVRLSEGAAYRPSPRATIFSSRVVGGPAGVGRQKPTGFGRVSIRTSRTTGAIVGRSGSFGRGGSHWG